jgi:methylenetetrahydrofolate dehydrogenase (NADP+)/methenyltetrahydrofolate cyclohydrolase
MTAKIIDGSAIAAQIQQELKGEVAFFTENNVQPCLAVVLVGDNPASKVYVRKKREACEAVGIASKLITNINNHYDLMDELEILNRSKDVHGILVQLPLPKDEWGDDYNLREVFEGISPWKDVDVFHPENVGLLVQGRPRFHPCTPHGIQIMLARSGIQVKGKHVVVINRSNVVGKPLSSMLIQDCDEYANATVTVCHDSTPPEQLKQISRSADVVVVAVGIPGFLKADMVGKGAVVVDVGITRVNGKILGDADPGVREVAGWVTPVPGGVGPMTVTMLLVNTLKAARMNCYER